MVNDTTRDDFSLHVYGQTRVRERVSARPAVSRAVRRTYSTVFGQQATTVHRIFISPLHAFVHLHRSSRIPCGNHGVVAEFTWTLRLRASSYDLSGKAASPSIGSATYGYEQMKEIFRKL